ncbi:MAG: recombination mediator RecR [Anaerolineales bacterium]|nr:recombination mediator RecR [Anaerolineales bacterium]MBS3752517.1 recombination mediator RecR [Anaerolineales bacterium]
MLPEPVTDLINAFSRLPGVGPKTASRLVFYLLRGSDDELTLTLADALRDLRSKTDYCPDCFNIMRKGRERCRVCSDPDRDRSLICVVEDPLDVAALERTSGFGGRYHVLHGALSPVEGVGPEDLKIKELLERVRQGEIKEVIIATNPSMEGDATGMYLRQQLGQMDVRLTRLARGLPMGGDLEYADQNTLLRALMGRQEME